MASAPARPGSGRGRSLIRYSRPREADRVRNGSGARGRELTIGPAHAFRRAVTSHRRFVTSARTRADSSPLAWDGPTVTQERHHSGRGHETNHKIEGEGRREGAPRGVRAVPEARRAQPPHVPLESVTPIGIAGPPHVAVGGCFLAGDEWPCRFPCGLRRERFAQRASGTTRQFPDPFRLPPARARTPLAAASMVGRLQVTHPEWRTCRRVGRPFAYADERSCKPGATLPGLARSPTGASHAAQRCARLAGPVGHWPAPATFGRRRWFQRNQELSRPGWDHNEIAWHKLMRIEEVGTASRQTLKQFGSHSSNCWRAGQTCPKNGMPQPIFSSRRGEGNSDALTTATTFSPSESGTCCSVHCWGGHSGVESRVRHIEVWSASPSAE